MSNLNPWYITGLTDGEGCFSLYVRKDTQKRNNRVDVYFRWSVRFAIRLREDDSDILEKVREYFDAGLVHKAHADFKKIDDKLDTIYFEISSVDIILEKVIPHFDKYCLQAKKCNEYNLWKEAVIILKTARSRPSINRWVKFSEAENDRLNEIFFALKKRLTGKKALYVNPNQGKQGTKEILNLA